MKKIFGIITVLLVSMAVSFTSCNKEESTKTVDDSFKTTELSLTSLEPDVVVRGTGNKDHYDKVVVEEIVKSEECDWEPVSGIIEYYYDGEMVFSVDFGDGECDGVATVSWIDEDDTLQSKVVDVWKLFKNQNQGNHRPKCFDFVFPVSFTMPDGSEMTIESADEWSLLREWYDANPGYEEKPTLNFPVDIVYEDETTATINSAEELKEARKDCNENGNGNHHGQKCFDFVLPVTFEMPDGTSIIIESEDDWSLIREWHIANPDYEEKGQIVFPVDIVYEDGTTLTVNSQEEMQDVRRDCRDARKCFTFNLPVSFTMPDESIITINTDDDWELIRLWYIDNPEVEERPTPVFPVEVTMQDGTVVTINSQEEMHELRQECNENGNGNGGNNGNGNGGGNGHGGGGNG